MKTNHIYQGDALEVLSGFPDKSVNCVITSPPYYGLRDYGEPDQIGLEETPEEYISKLVKIFREVKRVLKDDGTLWLNLGDSYWSKRSKNGQDWTQIGSKNGKHSLRAGGKAHPFYKPKDLMGMPWRVAIALQQDGWYLRSDIIWHKTNVLPEGVTDRVTKAHEYLFLLSKSEKYYFDYASIMEPAQSKEMAKSFRGGGKYTNNQDFDNDSFVNNKTVGNVENETQLRRKRSVWNVYPSRDRISHFATYPIELHSSWLSRR